eukprot:gene1795-3484_t
MLHKLHNMPLLSAIFIYVILDKCSCQTNVYNVKVSQLINSQATTSDFPEIDIGTFSGRPNTAISFSGGGSRSFISSIGILSALRELGLIENIRYVAGVSGGSWAAAVFTYSSVAKNDQELLGDIIAPERLTRYILKEINQNCARRFASADVITYAVSELVTNKAHSISDAWVSAIYKSYLAPAGIPSKSFFSWNMDTVEDIKKRNPILENATFLLPTNSNRPFPIITAGLIGPESDAESLYIPLDGYRNYTCIEFTPLYTGQIKSLDVEYIHFPPMLHMKRVMKQRVGGLIETFGVILDGTAPNIGLSSPTQKTAILQVPYTKKSITLEYIVSASSFAPGAIIAALPKKISDVLGMEFNYWSPTSTSPIAKKNFITDGGSCENTNLISFLQRKVKKIVLIMNSVTPLQPLFKWDVKAYPSKGNQIDVDLGAFFGIIPKDMDIEDRIAVDLSKNHVFSSEYWSDVVLSLQMAQMRGNGIIASINLTTIDNVWWGIGAGFETELTVVYLGRLPQWESLLPKDLQRLVIPLRNTSDNVDVSHTIRDGPFARFPHYETVAGGMNSERANLLANMVGWSVLQHADMFRNIFS